MTIHGDREKFTPFGLSGGLNGGGCNLIINKGTKKEFKAGRDATGVALKKRRPWGHAPSCARRATRKGAARISSIPRASSSRSTGSRPKRKSRRTSPCRGPRAGNEEGIWQGAGIPA